MPLPNLTFNPYVSPFAPGLGNVFTENLAHRQQAYEANADFADALGYNNDKLKQDIGPFASDYRQADEIFNKTRKKIDKWAEDANYENLGREISKGAREFQREISPLIENRKRLEEYNDVMDKAYASGHITHDTYQRSKAASVEKYKGYDKEKGSESLFRGFIPSKDVNLVGKVDELMANWKANGSYSIDDTGDGVSFRQVRWEEATADDIKKAIRSGFAGDNDVLGYEGTQNFIGNQDRFARERQHAEDYGINKYAYRREQGDLGFYPVNKSAAANLPMSPIPNEPVSSGVNPSKDPLEGVSKGNIVGGKVLHPWLSYENGKYFKFVNEKGEQVSQDDFLKNRARTTSQGEGFGIFSGASRFGHGMPIPTGYERVEIPKEEAEFLTKDKNDLIYGIAANERLANDIDQRVADLGNEGIFNDANLTEGHLRNTAKEWGSEENILKQFDNYKSASENSKVLFGNKRIPFSMTPGSATDETTGISNNELMANTLGKEVGILSTDEEVGGLADGEVKDINTMLKKIEDKTGLKYVSAHKLGIAHYNPFSRKGDMPGISYGLFYQDPKDKEAAPQMYELIVSQEDDEWKPVQRILDTIYNGKKAVEDVQVTHPNGKQGYFRVRTHTTDDPNRPGTNKKVFTGTVEMLDSNKRKISRTYPYEEFVEKYSHEWVPNIRGKYMNFKNIPKPMTPLQ